jgi:hypothetical protein
MKQRLLGRGSPCAGVKVTWGVQPREMNARCWTDVKISDIPDVFRTALLSLVSLSRTPRALVQLGRFYSDYRDSSMPCAYIFVDPVDSYSNRDNLIDTAALISILLLVRCNSKYCPLSSN